MTEQEQHRWDEINKMVEIVHNNCQNIFCDQAIGCDRCECIALYNAGYRKPSEGSVVLTKDELAGYIRLAKADAVVGEHDKAAKEVLSKLFSIVQDKRDALVQTTRDPSIGGQCKAYADIGTTIREIALEMGVEVKE